MIKNETKIIDENKNPLLNSMNGKGNKNREIYTEIQSDKFKTLYSTAFITVLSGKISIIVSSL